MPLTCSAMHRRLRVHHLLCIPLFRGEGYSDAFSRNMTEKIEWLQCHTQEKLKLICSPDMICEKCPNLTPEGTCRCSGNQVAVKDRDLCSRLGLSEHGAYTYQELRDVFQEKLTKEIFEASCGKCEWYAKGLCSFQAWKEQSN